MTLLEKLSENLTENKLIPWRFRHLGGPLNTLISAPLRRKKLAQIIAKDYDDKPDDITLIIGIKGRVNYRLENSLKSIRAQTYPKELIKITIVDYDNNDIDRKELQQLSKKYDVKLINVKNKPIWNKPNCLNIAIKQTNTKFMMPNDADMILSPNFIEEVIKALKTEPLSIVLAEMLDLPEELTPVLENYVTDNITPDIDFLKQHTQPRKTYTQTSEQKNVHISIHATYTFFYHMINGYDEFYTRWGAEDNDMFRRLYYFGLTPKNIQDKAFYMHQWHKKFESLEEDNLKEIINKNQRYFYNNHSIIRNPNGWGAK